MRAELGGDGLGDELERLFEVFSPELMELAPAQTVDVWIAAEFVDPVRLLPALLHGAQWAAALPAAPRGSFGRGSGSPATSLLS